MWDYLEKYYSSAHRSNLTVGSQQGCRPNYYGRHGRPILRLLCGRGTGFGLIAPPLCVGEENGWQVAYVA